jgi:enterobactin synthetase component D
LSQELWSLIGHPNELRRASALPEAVRGRWMMRVFSAKEAYYKWVYPQTRQVLEFLDVEIVLEPTMESTAFQVHPRHPGACGVSAKKPSGRLMIDQDTIISLVIH